MERRLRHPVHSVALKHNKYYGRIAWDATDPEGISFTIVAINKKKPAKKKISIPVISDGVFGMYDLESPSKLIVATIKLTKKHEVFNNNFYHPDFPKDVQKYVKDLLKDDIALKSQVESALNA